MISVIFFALYIAVAQTGTIILESDRWPYLIFLAAGSILGFLYDWRVLLHILSPMISGTVVALILSVRDRSDFLWAMYGLVGFLAMPIAIYVLCGTLLGTGVRVASNALAGQLSRRSR